MEKFSDDKFSVVGVNRDENWVLEKLKAKGNVTWRCFLAEKTEPPFNQVWGACTLGLLVLVDSEGIVQGIFGLKDLESGDVEDAISSLLHR